MNDPRTVRAQEPGPQHETEEVVPPVHLSCPCDPPVVLCGAAVPPPEAVAGGGPSTTSGYERPAQGDMCAACQVAAAFAPRCRWCGKSSEDGPVGARRPGTPRRFVGGSARRRRRR